MKASLDLTASLHGWQCSNCHQLFDAMWRPTKPEKAWAPPVSSNWAADRPTFNYCCNCGAEFTGKEPSYGDEIRT